VHVTLGHGFWIGQTEVTQKQWKGVMGTAPWENKGDYKEEDDCPARWVDYNDAGKFCKTVTAEERRAGRLPADEEYVLPTEAQWEYAARAGTTTAYSFGDRESELGQYAWFRNNTEDAHQAYAHPVAKKKPNPWGLYDVHGNVAEWCRDFYAEAISGGVDPVGPPFGQYRVCRAAIGAIRPPLVGPPREDSGNRKTDGILWDFVWLEFGSRSLPDERNC
jgi:formylglycine-generating enzyme required for sulfatase activity